MNIEWTGRSGTKYEFSLHLIDEDLEPIAACYIFTKQTDNNRWSAIYIGETGDLSVRFDDHHKMICCYNEGATHICVYTTEMEDKSVRLSVEEDLIENYRPLCNSQKT